MEQNIERKIKSIIKESIYTVIKEREEDISTKIIKSLQRGSLDEECISLWEEMDDYNKLYYLWESGFNGLCNIDDFLSIGECLNSTDKDYMLRIINDELSNKVDGYDVEDSNHYYIKYSNDSLLNTSEYESIKYPKQGIRWISPNGGLTVNSYYVSNVSSEDDLVNEMGFHRIVNGEIEGIDFNYEQFHRMSEDWIQEIINKDILRGHNNFVRITY